MPITLEMKWEEFAENVCRHKEGPKCKHPENAYHACVIKNTCPYMKKKKRTPPLAWKKSYEEYKKEALRGYQEVTRDQKTIAEWQEVFGEDVDILKSIAKSYVQFWSGQAGWKNKKRKPSKSIDWKATYRFAVTSFPVKKTTHEEKPVDSGLYEEL